MDVIMRILIIGSNGFVGSLLMERLATLHDTCGIDLGWFGPDLGHSLCMDMSNLSEEFVAPFDLIVCLAGHSSVPMCTADPAGAIKNNVVNMVRLLDIMRTDQKLIYASSSSIYGAGKLDATEQQVSYQLSNAYDATKQIFDDIATDAIDRGRLIVGLRLGSVVGVSPNTRTDIAINNMMLTAHRSKEFWIADPQLHRSWLAVNDAVSAIITIAESEQFIPGMYNVKSFDCTIGDVARAIQRITGYDYTIKNSMHSTYDFTISIDKLNADYGWKPGMDLDKVISTVHSNIPHMAECRRDTVPGEATSAV